MPTEPDLRRQIVEIGKLMYQKGWIAANDGNISARIDADTILVTPTGVSKGMMREEDLAVCDMQGRQLRGDRRVTTEVLMHLTIYELRPAVQAVVHAHPPAATGFAVAGRALDVAILPEVVIYLGSVPLAPYGLPGTPELSERLRTLVANHDAVLLANHGAVTCGKDLERAFFNMETVEHVARISLVAEMLGGPTVLPQREVDRLVNGRSKYGVANNGEGPATPLSAEQVQQRRRALEAVLGSS